MNKPYYLADVLDSLRKALEYKLLSAEVGPKSSPDQKKQAGKIFVDMTGGTEGAREIFKAFEQRGTIAACTSVRNTERGREPMSNVNAGHIASDNPGEPAADETLKGFMRNY
jgi:hypothetical protein